MTGSIRSIFKDFLLYGGSDFAARLLGFVTLPIYTRVFSAGEYGMMSFMFSVTLLLASIVTIGGDQLYVRFYFEAADDRERATITPTWILFIAAWGAAVTTLVLPWSESFAMWSFGRADYDTLIMIAVLGVPLSVLNRVCGHVLRARFRPGLGAVLNLATAVLSVVLGLVGAVPLGLGLVGIFGGVLVAELLMLPLRLWSIRSLLALSFSFTFLRRALAFGFPLVPTLLAIWVFTMSDRVMLSQLASFEDVGRYGVAAALVSIISLANLALTQALGPHAMSAYESTPAQAAVLYGRVLTYVLAGFGILCVVVTAFGAEIIMILTTAEFHAGAQAVGPLALGLVAYATTQITSLGAIVVKKTRYLALCSFLAAMANVAFNFFLIPRFGMMGAAWATMAAYVLLTLSYMIVSQRLFAIAYETQRALTAIGLVVVFTLAVPQLPTLEPVPLIFSKIGLVGVFFVLLFVLRILDWRTLSVLWGLLEVHRHRGKRDG
ncbi:MAG: hypothetical protein D6763_08890 [Alphaproteobacteria bacterium]|nr:MAG: hypothetical protein D6763_08890 [Alphaproteobacteria bacterium]